MIYDTLDHIDRYSLLLPGISEGLRFLRQAPADIAPGLHCLSGDNYANVDLYTTREVNPLGYEAHRRYIDIQYLLSGEEEILVRPVEQLDCTTPYDAGRDVAFYRHDLPAATVRLGNGAFAILFPHDAHEPQHAVAHPAPVKKIVVKIALPATLNPLQYTFDNPQ